MGEWLPFIELTKKLKDTENFVKSVLEAPEDKFEYVFTIRMLNKFAGLIGFNKSDKLNTRTEIGYWLSEKYQKQGIVTQAVSKLSDFAFNEQDINRIQIKCAVGNTKSMNIPLKLGFKLEGIERDGELKRENIFTDLKVFSKLKND